MIGQVVFAIIQTFIAFGVGAFARWRGMLRPEQLGTLTRFTLNVFMTMMVFSSVSDNLRGAGWRQVVLPPFLGFGMSALWFLAGWPLASLLKRGTPERRSAFMHLSTVNNFLFLPIIIVENIWGGAHVAMLLLMSVGFTVSQWTLGILPFGGGNCRETLKKLCNPNLAAALLGILVAVLDCPIPKLADSTIRMLGGITVPLMLVIIGAALPDGCRRLVGDTRDLLWYSLCRLIILPLLAAGIMKQLPLDEPLCQTAMVVALMPGSSAGVLIVRSYSGDYEFAGSAIVLSTLFSLGTVPLLLWLLGL